MRRMAFLSLLLCLGVFSAFAQLGKKDSKSSYNKHNSHLQEGAHQETQKLKQQYGLSEAQTSKVFNATLTKNRKIDYLRYRKDLDKKEKVAEKDSIASWYKGQLREIMTEVQYVEYKNTMHMQED